MLTSAFGGYDLIMEAYQTAMKEKYRMHAYGDACWSFDGPAFRIRKSRPERSGFFVGHKKRLSPRA